MASCLGIEYTFMMSMFYAGDAMQWRRSHRGGWDGAAQLPPPFLVRRMRFRTGETEGFRASFRQLVGGLHTANAAIHVYPPLLADRFWK